MVMTKCWWSLRLDGLRNRVELILMNVKWIAACAETSSWRGVAGERRSLTAYKKKNKVITVTY